MFSHLSRCAKCLFSPLLWLFKSRNEPFVVALFTSGMLSLVGWSYGLWSKRIELEEDHRKAAARLYGEISVRLWDVCEYKSDQPVLDRVPRILEVFNARKAETRNEYEGVSTLALYMAWCEEVPADRCKSAAQELVREVVKLKRWSVAASSTDAIGALQSAFRAIQAACRVFYST